MRRLCRVLLLALLGACGDDEPSAPAPIVHDEELCDRIPADVYVAGIERTSPDGRLRVKILDAEPAPPAVGDNAWTVEVSGGGAPLRVEATNPDRELEPARAPVVTTVDEAKGRFRVERLLLALPGRWQITFGDPTPGPHGVVTFSFCVSS